MMLPDRIGDLATIVPDWDTSLVVILKTFAG